jgi:hypothetical protein
MTGKSSITTQTSANSDFPYETPARRPDIQRRRKKPKKANGANDIQIRLRASSISRSLPPGQKRCSLAKVSGCEIHGIVIVNRGAEAEPSYAGMLTNRILVVRQKLGTPSG